MRRGRRRGRGGAAPPSAGAAGKVRALGLRICRWCNAYNLRHRNEAILEIARAMQLPLDDADDLPDGLARPCAGLFRVSNATGTRAQIDRSVAALVASIARLLLSLSGSVTSFLLKKLALGLPRS